jgi:hypothetical protein
MFRKRQCQGPPPRQAIPSAIDRLHSHALHRVMVSPSATKAQPENLVESQGFARPLWRR